MAENNNHDIAGVKRDESIDVSALVRSASDATPVVPEPSVPETVQEEAEASVSKVMSPLEQMKAEKENGNDTKGVVVDTEELKKSAKSGLKLATEMYDEHLEERLKESDELLEKRKHVVILQSTRTEQELVEAAEELESLKHDESTGTWYFDNKGEDGQPKEPKYFRIRTEEDGEYSYESEAQKVGVNPDTTETKSKSAEDQKAEEEKARKHDLVEIIIDKSQNGDKIEFTPEEREKLFEASEIKLKQIEVKELPTSKSKRTTDDEPGGFRGFLKKHNIGRNYFTIYFPASGFRADMIPLTYGEICDISVDIDTTTVDKYIKRMTIIYNHMTNISIGSFDSFEDFLKNFAYTDIPIALFGLYVASYPEIQRIQMQCGNCNEYFEAIFTTRSLYDLENCSVEYLEKLKNLMDASPSEFDKVHNESPVLSSINVEMPNSKFIFSMGVASAYEFIYNYVYYSNEDNFKKVFPNDINETQKETSLLLYCIRSVTVQAPDGNVQTFTNARDILDAIYSVDPDEIRILVGILERIVTVYTPKFIIKNVKCTKCGTITEGVEIDMDTLIFMTAQTLKTTPVDASTMLV